MTETERLVDAAARLDAERFVGRAAHLRRVDAAFAGTSDHRIFFVDGPGGVGKSTLLRAIARRAVALGRPVVAINGRLLAPDPDALAAAIAPAADDRTLLLIDEVDELTPLRLELRNLLHRVAPASSVIVLAGRRPLGREWFDGELAPMVATIALRPLPPAEGRELLRRYGMTDAARIDAVLAWSAGYPLALALAASMERDAEWAADGESGSFSDGLPGDSLDERLLRHLAGHELPGVDPDVLDVACIAPAIDARLLAAALPGRATRTGLAQLRALSVAEQLGARTTLHRLVRAALRSRLRDTDPDRYRTIVLRVAEHLRTRALTEDRRMAVELGDLIDDPSVRVGFDPSTTHYLDRPRPGDLDTVATTLGIASTAWWQRTRRWCDERPDQAMIIRRADGSVAAMAISFNGERIPEWAEDDIVSGPAIRHARANGRLAESTFVHDLLSLEAPDDVASNAEVGRVGNAGVVSRSGLRLPRYVYWTDTQRYADDGTEVLGYGEVPELRRSDGERSLLTICSDFGPDGFVGRLYSIILAEQQAPEAATSGRAAALVDGLRGYLDDATMASSPLGSGHGEERVRTARAEVRGAVERSFADTPADRLLREALERTYLTPGGGHGTAQRELHMSRSSFFRHLQRAREQLVANESLGA